MQNKITVDSLEQELAQLEAIGNDDIALISEFGPSYYDTEELLDLLFFIKTTTDKTTKLQKVLFGLTSLFVLSLASAVFYFATSRFLWGYISLCFIPVLGIAAWLYTYYFHKKNNDLAHKLELKTLIENELEKRNIIL